MKKNILRDCLLDQECTGCSMCAAVCKTNAISINLTEEGFYKPFIDNDLCTGCNICTKYCYKFDEKIIHKKEEECFFYSFINKNSDELKTSTSGGVSYELMKQCINLGYKVLGVAYDYNKDIAITKIANNINDLKEFKGSKYFQSYTLEALMKITNEHSKYAVFGTPCQIYSISKFIKDKNIEENFILVDIFCHGCPSINLWNKYLKYIKEKLDVKIFDKIEFRSKAYGWHEYSNTFYGNNKVYNSSKSNDEFFNIFFDGNILNQACYKCKLRSTFKYSDIRLGDFWGKKYNSNTKGVSAVVVSSNKGKILINNIKENFIIKEHNYKEVISFQSYGIQHNLNNEIRNYTLKLLNSQINIKEVMKKCRRKYSKKKRIKFFARRVIKSMPNSWVLNIRKFKYKIRI
ncbi:Coenzyme F420 hydrogenase/dehydrogenase, beta subunit C-terminal domain [Clostridium perfringens]